MTNETTLPNGFPIPAAPPGAKGVFMTRYTCQGRSSWVPAQYVVVDTATGEIVSRHVSEAAARDAALGMNKPRPKLARA